MQTDRKLLIVATAALAAIGLLMVYSSSITSRPSFLDQRFLLRQLTFLATGVTIAGLAARLPLEFWRRAAFPLFAISVVLLVAVLIPGVGARLNGARRWFRIGSISFQPSELAKFALVLFLARALELKGADVRRFWNGWLPLMIPSLVVCCLVLLEPDFGTAIFLLGMALVLFFLAGIPYWHLLVVLGAIVPSVGTLVLTQPYRIERILHFVQAWSDPSAAPYQVQQSLVAVGSGGLWGAGLGRGWQKLGFLPEANTDFVFAVLGEELGLAGTLTVLGLWGVFLLCGVRLTRQVLDDPFGYMVSFGLIVQLVFQSLMNVGVVTASLPAKGISLPFISCGGSNLLISLVSVGAVLGVTRQESRESRITDRGSSIVQRKRRFLGTRSSVFGSQSPVSQSV